MPRINAAPKPPADFRQLARTISRRTTNGLAMAIVLVAGLGFGRQVMLWWRDAPPNAAPPPADSLADAAGLRQLEFGSATARFQTQTVLGERPAALAELRRLVQRVGAAGLPPAREMGPAEARLLADIEQNLPAAERDRPRLDALDEIMPTVVSSRPVPVPGQPPVRRIVALGFALPSDGGWTLYAFEFSGQAAGASAGEEIPLPPTSRRSLSLQQPDGGVVTAFHGLPGASSAGWEQFFAIELPRRGWQLQGGWHSEPATNDAGLRAARYSMEAGDGAARWLDLQWNRDERGQLSGALTLGPPQSRSRS